MSAPIPVSVSELTQRLIYDSETGVITYKNGRKAGLRAGSLNAQGYRRLCLRSRYVAEHRAAWALHFGSFPDGFIDHINGIKSDNRMVNLRMATHSQNVANRGLSRQNTSGLKGVTRLPHGRWQAQIGVNGRTRYIGSFDTKEGAAEAYAKFAKVAFAEFHNLGKASTDHTTGESA